MITTFKLFYQNTRGLRERISLSNYNIIALTETWLKDGFPSESIFDQNLYTVYRRILFHNKNIDEAVDLFYSTIFEILSKHTPTTTFTHDKYPIWYSYELIQILNEKEYYRKQIKKTKLPIFTILFNSKRKQFKKLKKKMPS